MKTDDEDLKQALANVEKIKAARQARSNASSTTASTSSSVSSSGNSSKLSSPRKESSLEAQAKAALMRRTERQLKKNQSEEYLQSLIAKEVIKNTFLLYEEEFNRISGSIAKQNDFKVLKNAITLFIPSYFRNDFVKLKAHFDSTYYGSAFGGSENARETLTNLLAMNYSIKRLWPETHSSGIRDYTCSNAYSPGIQFECRKFISELVKFEIPGNTTINAAVDVNETLSNSTPFDEKRAILRLIVKKYMQESSDGTLNKEKYKAIVNQIKNSTEKTLFGFNRSGSGHYTLINLNPDFLINLYNLVPHRNRGFLTRQVNKLSEEYYNVTQKCTRHNAKIQELEAFLKETDNNPALGEKREMLQKQKDEYTRWGCVAALAQAATRHKGAIAGLAVATAGAFTSIVFPGKLTGLANMFTKNGKELITGVGNMLSRLNPFGAAAEPVTRVTQVLRAAGQAGITAGAVSAAHKAKNLVYGGPLPLKKLE